LILELGSDADIFPPPSPGTMAFIRWTRLAQPRRGR
jgi:hypothetical protein